MYAWDLAMVTVSFSGLKKYSQEVAEGGAGARGNSQVLDAPEAQNARPPKRGTPDHMGGTPQV